jgi:hypothetical protein
MGVQSPSTTVDTVAAMVAYVTHARCGRIDPVRGLPSSGHGTHTSTRVILTLQAGSPVV